MLPTALFARLNAVRVNASTCDVRHDSNRALRNPSGPREFEHAGGGRGVVGLWFPTFTMFLPLFVNSRMGRDDGDTFLLVLLAFGVLFDDVRGERSIGADIWRGLFGDMRGVGLPYCRSIAIALFGDLFGVLREFLRALGLA